MFTGLILVSFIFALIFSAILMSFNRRGPGPWYGFLFFFVLMFLIMWAFGPWIRPAGPLFLGISWLPLFVFGLIIALLSGAMVPPAPKTPRHRTENELSTEEANESVKLALGVVFWILIIGLIIVIIANTI